MDSSDGDIGFGWGVEPASLQARSSYGRFARRWVRAPSVQTGRV